MIAGIPVDTHVRRLVQRLGLTKKDIPDKIEQDLMKLVPQKLWGKFSYLLKTPKGQSSTNFSP